MKDKILNLIFLTFLFVPTNANEYLPENIQKEEQSKVYTTENNATVTAANTQEEGQSEMFELLKEWCDALIRHQLNHSSKNIDGGLICPGCGIMHGRAADAIYPLMYVAEKTGDTHYIEVARKVFA